MSFENVVIRTSPKLQSIGGIFVSTFFGGDDSSCKSTSITSLRYNYTSEY